MPVLVPHFEPIKFNNLWYARMRWRGQWRVLVRNPHQRKYQAVAMIARLKKIKPAWYKANWECEKESRRNQELIKKINEAIQ